jgi:hypothetical protein
VTEQHRIATILRSSARSFANRVGLRKIGAVLQAFCCK